jgi:hypothetical protein
VTLNNAVVTNGDATDIGDGVIGSGNSGQVDTQVSDTFGHSDAFAGLLRLSAIIMR